MNSPDGTASDFKKTDIYRRCVEIGLIPGDKNELSQQTFAAVQNDFPKTEHAFEEKLVQEMILRVEGMWCPACSWVVEEVLRRTEGVIDAQVIFLSDQAKIKYLPQMVDPPTMLAQISKLGYRPTPFLVPSVGSPEKRNLLLRFGVSSIFTMNIMMISFFLYYGFFDEFGQEVVRYFSYPLWFLSTAVLAYGGIPIFTRAYHAIRYGTASMDLLITVGAMAAYCYSIVQIARGSIHLYFDTASMLITLVLFGRYIETKAKEKVSSAVEELTNVAHHKVRLSADAGERWVSSERVEPGEEFLVLAGERVPLDGRITSGRAKVDQSILTGESRPVTKEVGDEVLGGTLLLENELKLRTIRIGRESTLGQMLQLVQEALSRKNPFELLSDRIMRWFVPVIFGLAASTALYLRLEGVSVDVALLRAVTILVITCPCALGIASPLVKIAAVGKSQKRGILIRDPRALEDAKDLDVLVFDKTGTITEGKFSLKGLVSGTMSMEEAVGLIASVEIHSDHFLAREIVRKAKELALSFDEAQSYEAWDGLGVKGLSNGKEVVVGNRLLMANRGLVLPIDLDQNARISESQGVTVVFFGWEKEVKGILLFGDSVKHSSRTAIRDLQKRGIELWLVSGDAEETTRAVADELGIERFSGQALPKDKVEIIKTLQKKGHRVGMVGDGFNDAAALVHADVGFALGTSLNISREASDITLITGDPAKVAEVLDLSALTVRTIRQNLLLAFLYNGLALPLAVTGLLNPLIAVVAMFGSSLSVIGNSFKIFKATT